MTPRRVCSHIGFALLTFLVLADGGFWYLLYQLNRAGIYQMPVQQYYLAYSAVMYVVAAPCLLLLLRLVPRPLEKPTAAPRLRMTPGRFAAALLVCMGAGMFTGLVAQGFSLLVRMVPLAAPGLASALDWLPRMAVRGSLPFPQKVLFMALLPALGEEALFRIGLRRALRGAGDKAFILISGVCFGLCHLSFRQSAGAAAAGFLLAWLYVRTGKARWPMLVHFCNNLVSLLAQETVWRPALVALTLLIFACLAVSVALVWAWGRDELGALAPPTAPGWPWKPPRRAKRPPRLPVASLPRLARRFSPPPPAGGFGPGAQHPAWQNSVWHGPVQDAAPAGLPRPEKGLAAVCFANPGMLAFLLAAGAFTLLLLWR